MTWAEPPVVTHQLRTAMATRRQAKQPEFGAPRNGDRTGASRRWRSGTCSRDAPRGLKVQETRTGSKSPVDAVAAAGASWRMQPKGDCPVQGPSDILPATSRQPNRFAGSAPWAFIRKKQGVCMRKLVLSLLIVARPVRRDRQFRGPCRKQRQRFAVIPI